MDANTDKNPEPQVVFRPGKKRKIYRQRGDDYSSSSDVKPVAASSEVAREAATLEQQAADDNDNDGGANDMQDSGLSVAEALRLRNARRSRLRGVEFRRDDTASSQPKNQKVKTDGSLVPYEPDLEDMTKRFAPQTGLVGELVNKHMEEYIESELARRHQPVNTSSASPADNYLDGHFLRPHSSDQVPHGGVKRKTPAALSGKIQEIDLGDEVRLRNAAMTERARRRLAGEDIPPEDDEDEASRSKKVKLGPDGKPWRGRQRRGSEDIKRDQIVEQFLHENRLDEVYEKPAQATGPGAADDEDDEEGADARVAAQFRREYMDAVSQIRRRKAARAASRKNTKRTVPDEDVLKGPKLGGSRNARAAMRDKLLEQQQQQRAGKR